MLKVEIALRFRLFESIVKTHVHEARMRLDPCLHLGATRRNERIVFQEGHQLQELYQVALEVLVLFMRGESAGGSMNHPVPGHKQGIAQVLEGAYCLLALPGEV